MNFLLNASLSDYGSVSSIAGLFITAFTVALIFGIKKRFLFTSSVDEHEKSLGEIASKISGFLQSYSKNANDIDDAFAIADVKLRNIQNGANGYLLSDVKIARSKIKSYRSTGWLKRIDHKNEEFARETNTAINVVVEELKNVRKKILVGG